MSDRIFVTGGAGYIGAHCCKHLAAAGYIPVVYDDLSSGHSDFVRWGPLIQGDVRDFRSLVDAISACRPAAVMHFAALALVGESVSNPERYWDVNVGGVRTLLEAMRATGRNTLVFSSTCAIYGEPEAVPLVETTAKAPVSPYGASKLAAELMIESYDVAYDLRSVRLRYFNACGADPDGDIGESHDPETHLIPLILDAVTGARGPVSVFGRDYPTEDGTAVRDYVHVCDLARAHVGALGYLQDGNPSTALNLGTGQGTSVAEIIAAVERVTGLAVPFIDTARRAGDPPCLIAAPDEAQRKLDWHPSRSTIDDVVTDAWRWHLSAQPSATPTDDALTPAPDAGCPRRSSPNASAA